MAPEQQPTRPKANGLREYQRKMRREAVLDMANRLFIEQGYASVSIEEIAASALMSKPTLYSMFRSKDEIAVGIALRALEETLEFLTSQRPGESARAFLFRFIDWAAEFRFGSQARIGWDVARAVLPHEKPELRGHEERMLDRIGEIIAQGQADGDLIRDVPPKVLAGLLISTQSGVMDDLLRRGQVTVDELVASWKRLLVPQP